MPKISDYDECGHGNFHEFGRCLYKYTSCGPWVVAVLTDGREVYYGDKEAWALSMDTEVQCLRVGSIVEGSDVEVGPRDVTTPESFYAAVTEIDAECDFYWRRDNLEHFEILRDNEPIGYVVCGQGECSIELDRKRISKKDRAAVTDFCRAGSYRTPCLDIKGAVNSPAPGDVIDIAGTTLQLKYFVDDSSY